MPPYLDHRQHKGVAEEIANIWTLFAEKVSDLFNIGREINWLGHLNIIHRTRPRRFGMLPNNSVAAPWRKD